MENRNLDLNITDFATVNFKALADAVDVLGGIPLTINSEKELQNLNDYIGNMNHINGGNSPKFEKTGTYTFDGNQAVAYSRLSYEMNKKDEEKAVSSMAIMTGEKGADIRSLKDELNWYRGRISEHLFVLDQEAVSEYVENMEDASAGDILAELIRSIVTEGAHKVIAGKLC